jgi:hypothetical protein
MAWRRRQASGSRPCFAGVGGGAQHRAALGEVAMEEAMRAEEDTLLGAGDGRNSPGPPSLVGRGQLYAAARQGADLAPRLAGRGRSRGSSPG